MIPEFFASNKFDSDDREPSVWWEISLKQSLLSKLLVYTFTRPENSDDYGYGKPAVGLEVGFVHGDMRFWGIIFTMLLSQTFFNVVLAVIIYFVVVVPQLPLETSNAKENAAFPPKNAAVELKARPAPSASAYILCYGVVCPLVLYWPFLVVSYCGLRNTSFAFTVTATTSLILSFRCLEALYGTHPPYVANRGLWQFLLYSAAAIPFLYDDSTGLPVPITRKSFLSKLRRGFFVQLQTSLLFSLLIPFNYQVFPSRQIGTPMDLFYWGNLANAYLMASLTSLVMESSAMGLGLLFSTVFGIDTPPIHDSPITQSASPSEFWSRRWNSYVAQTLRRGVYLPLRLCGGFSPICSMIGTFAVSGFLHEFVLVVFRQVSNSKPTRDFGHFGFFLWCGIVIVLERLILRTRQAAVLQSMSRRLSPRFRSFLVVLTVLPLSFLFTDEYVSCGVYSDLAMGFPRVLVRLKPQSQAS
jgi:Membrane bound O-acyl transferase family